MSKIAKIDGKQYVNGPLLVKIDKILSLWATFRDEK